MRWELILSALILVGAVAPGARADVVAAPNFSTEETQTIARNELLRGIFQGDPWLVRQLLDMAARARAETTGSVSPQSQVDPKLDPDLAISPRDAQGIVEWNQLIRRAKQEKEQRGKALDASTMRSAEGTLDMIELARQAKTRKENGGLP
jgi:hypothetical protein